MERTVSANIFLFFDAIKFKSEVGFCPKIQWLSFAVSLQLIFVSLFSAGLQKGLFPIGITSIEKRFGFESWMTGLLFTTYDIGFILSSLFVTYNLRNMGVPRIIAWALVLFSVGSLLFALPHFLTDLYQYTSTDREGIFDLLKCPSPQKLGVRLNMSNILVCYDDEQTCDGVESENLSAWLALFIFAQFILGCASGKSFNHALQILIESILARICFSVD